MAKSKTKLISSFGGINRQKKCDTGEFYVAENVCLDQYPCIASVDACKKFVPKDVDGNILSNIRAVLCPEGELSELFSGVSGTDFYYQGKKIPFFGDAKIPEKGKIEIEVMNGNIIICCYESFSQRAILYYNYHNFGLDKRKFSKGYVVRLDCMNFSESQTTGMDFLPAAKSSSDSSCYRLYYDSDTFFSDINVGDSIVLCNLIARKMKTDTYDYARETLIRESRYTEANDTDEVACIVTDKVIGENSSYIEYTAYNTEGKVVEAKGYTSNAFSNQERMTEYDHEGPVFRRATPVINSICVHNNRLWATNPNGEYIYASKLGDFREFNCFQGVASDSYYMGFGSEGGFVGLVSFKSYIVAFKKDCIYLISGSTPNSFSISRTIKGLGCLDIRSCTELDGRLYFLSRDGFYCFDGISFENVSRKLNKKYTMAVGTGVGEKYYVYATDQEGKSEFLVYDSGHSGWYSLSDIGNICEFFVRDGEVFVTTDECMFAVGKEKNCGWKVESGDIFENNCNVSFPNSLWIRAKIQKGKTVRVFSSEDDGEYTEHTVCRGTGKLRVYSVPIRWHNAKSHKIKLIGNGEALIYDIEIQKAGGGREYRKDQRGELI